jgi:hypothetical protein
MKTQGEDTTYESGSSPHNTPKLLGPFILQNQEREISVVNKPPSLSIFCYSNLKRKG